MVWSWVSGGSQMVWPWVSGKFGMGHRGFTMVVVLFFFLASSGGGKDSSLSGLVAGC